MSFKYGFPLEDNLSTGIDCPALNFNGKLRDIQQEPINAFIDTVNNKKKLGGIISVPCGFGKTIMAIYVACYFKKKTLFISHKDGTGPEAFGQYGGVSESSSGSLVNVAKIYQNPEVQEYLSKLYRLYDNAVNGGRSILNNPFNERGVLTKGLYKLVQGSQLVNHAVYGPDYGGAFGPDNVHIIGQGQFVFTPLLNEEDDLYFKLSFTGPMEVNGDTSVFLNNNSGYRATIITTFRSGRPTGTPLGVVPQTRTGIYPRRYRQSAISIDMFIV